MDARGQTFLFELGEPRRTPASETEIMEVINRRINKLISARHRGKPPRICDYSWDDFQQEVAIRAAERCIGKFAHGGTKSLEEFVCGAIYFALRDVQRKSVSANKKYSGVLDVPILDYIDAIA